MRALHTAAVAVLLVSGVVGAADSGPVRAGVPGEVQGRLAHSATGDPRDGVVRARLPDGRELETRVGADGLFRIAGLPVFGAVDLELGSGDSPPLRLSSVPVPGDGPLDLGDVGFGAPVALEVLVLDPLGAPVPRQRITVHRPAFMAGGHSDATFRIPAPMQQPAEAVATTADDGRAPLPPLAPGSVVVQVLRGGFARAVEPRFLREGEVQDPVVVVLEPEAVVTGSLKDATGAPVAGARVSLGWAEFPVDAPGFTSDAAVTGSDGVFRIHALHPGLHVLAVRTGTGRVYMKREVFAGRGGPLDLVLPGGAEMRVRVVAEEDGTPLAGTPVELQVHQESGPGWTSWFRTVADSGGVAHFRDLPPGRVYSLRPLVPGRIPAPELTSRSGRWDLVAGAPREDEVRVARGVVLSGTVHDGKGKPLPGARLRVVSHDEGLNDACSLPPVRCDGEGRFRIDGIPPGEATVLVEPPIVGDSGVDGEYWEIAEKRNASGILSLRVGRESEQDVTWKAVTGGTVRGTVKDSEGKPVAGMVVNVFPERPDTGGPMGRAGVTASDGSFAVQALAGAPGTRVYAWCWGAGGRQGRSPVFALDEEGAGSGAAVVVEEGAGLAGRAVDGDGKPVPGSRLLLFSGKSPRMEEWRSYRMSSAPLAVPVGPDGRFRREGLRRGWWTPVLMGPGLEPAMGSPVELRPGAILDMGPLTAVPSSILEGVVQSSSGAPVAGALVSIELLREEMPEELPGESPIRTDSSGHFSHIGGPPGRYAVTVEAPGFQRATVPVLGGDRSIRVVMKPALSISGRVLDAETRMPVPGIEVEIGDRFEIGRTFPAILTNAEGAFRAEGLPPGPREIEVGKGTDGREDYAPVVLDGIEAGTKDLVIRLRRGLTISGRVLDSSGRPVEDQVVQVELERNFDETPEGEPSFLTRWVPTGPDGTFVAKGLLAGKYRIRVEDYNAREGGEPAIPVERLHIEAGSGGLEFVQHRGIQLRVRLTDGEGNPVKVEGGSRDGEHRYMVWTRRTRAPTPGDKDYREETEVEKVLGPSWRYWNPAIRESDGTFTQSPYVSGVEYEVLAVDAREGQWGRVRATVEPRKEIPVALRAGLDLEGVVVDNEGKSVPRGVPVWAGAREDLPPEASRAGVRTEEEGKFRIKGLVDGAYVLHAGGGHSEFLVSSEEVVALPAGEPVRLVVKRGVEISGRIIDRSGGLGRATAIVAHLEGAPSEAPVAEDGSFLLRGLPAGEIDLQVWVSGHDERGVSFSYTLDFLHAQAPAMGLELDITEERAGFPHPGK